MSSSFHYPISASTAKVWMNCPAAPWMGKLCKQDEPSDAMKRGTRIHEYAQLIGVGRDIPSGADPDEVAYASRYVQALRSSGDEWMFEHQAQYNQLASTTMDASVFDGHKKIIKVVDLKTGQHPVDPRNNSQLIFALMQWSDEGANGACFLSLFEIHLGIYQELNDGTPPMRWWCPTWAELKPLVDDMRAKIEAATEGGTPTPGAHCKQCRGKGACGAYAEKMGKDMPRASTLSPKEAVAIMREASEAEEWHKSVRRAWTSAAESGQLPGCYTIKVKSALKWTAGRDLPSDWLVKVPKKPNQIINAKLATEEELVERGFAVRPPPQTRVRFEGVDEPEEITTGGF